MLSALGSGIRASSLWSRNRENRPNSRLLPWVTAAASSGPKSQKNRNGVSARNSSPMNRSGGEGDSRTMVRAIRRIWQSTNFPMRSPKARLPNLVMVLQEGNKGGGRQVVTGLAPGFSVAEAGGLTLIGKPFGQATAQMRDRRVRIVGVVAVLLSGQRDLKSMMEIIIPLRRVERHRSIARPASDSGRRYCHSPKSGARGVPVPTVRRTVSANSVNMSGVESSTMAWTASNRSPSK